MELQPFVPQEWCFACRRCCRFPDTHDVQTPVLSSVEVHGAVQAGASPSWFRPASLLLAGSHDVQLVPHGCGYRCPALDSATHQCRIYAARPLDCRLYPLAITRDATGRRVMLQADPKCPYLQQLGPSPALRDYGWYLTRLLNSAQGQALLAANPALAGRPREEFWAVAPLDDPMPPALSPAPDGFRPLIECGPAFDEVLNRSGRPLSAYHRAAWWPWRDLLQMWWGSLGGRAVIVAEQAGGYFLPLPPLGGPLTPDVVRAAFDWLDAVNHGTAVSRIENFPSPLADRVREWGYEIQLAEREYVYDRTVLQSRAHRAGRAARGTGVVLRPLGPDDIEPCQRLYALWALRRQAATADAAARAMLRDGGYVHRRWLEDAAALGVEGVVADSDGDVRGYTLWTGLSEDTAVVLAEVADDRVPGLAARLTEAVCRRVMQPWLNAMGDAGMARLARVKLADHPDVRLPVWTAIRRR